MDNKTERGRFDDLLSSITLVSCGVCCSSGTLCPKCEISTLRANGLPVELQQEISGLSYVWSGNRGFQFSPLYNKLKELRNGN